MSIRIQWLDSFLFIARCIAFGTAGTVSGCAHALTTAPGYAVKEIPYDGVRIVWIDNESLLFVGERRVNDDESTRGARWSSPAVFRWNVRTESVDELMKAGPAADLCFDRGYLYIAFNRGDDRVIRHGPMQQLREIAYKRNGPPPFEGHFNRHTCRWQEIPKATSLNHGVVRILRDDHGHIEGERPSEPYPQRTYFLVPPTGNPISTTLRGAAGGEQFSEFAKGYVFQDGGGLMDASVDRRLQVLHLDGRVSVYRLPPGQWMRGAVYGMPVRGAVLMVSLSRLAKADGAYLVKDERVQRIVNGYISNFAVSPDGCKVGMRTSPASGMAPRMAMINVCKGGD